MKQKLAGLVMFLLLVSSNYSMAIDTEKDTTSYLKTIELAGVEIKGFKQDKTFDQTGSITNINSRFLRSNEINSVKELSSFIPNLFMPDYGSKQNTPIYIRGIGSKINAPSIGFYVDGVPHFEKSAFDVDLSDISNIEVLRGPQGTLYGRNAIGGIINIYTHSPLDYQNTRFKVSYGSRNDMELSATNYTKINNHFGFSITGKYHQNDGFFTNQYTNKKADDIRNGAGRISLAWRPAEDWTIRLSSSIDLSKQGGYPYGAYNAETKEWKGVNYDSYSSYRRTMVASGLTINHEGKAVSFNSQTSHQYIDDKQGIDQDFTPEATYFVNQKFNQQMWSEELTFKSKNSKRYHWITGLFLFTQKSDNFVGLNYLQKEYSTPKYYDIPTSGVAVYHQSTYDITKSFSVTAGLRYDYESAKNNYEAYKQPVEGERVATDNFVSKLHFSQITPKLTLQNRFANNQMVYASVTRGYKAGGFNLTFQEDNERSFGPEYNWNYEVGTELTFFNNKLTSNISLFYIDWRHQQISRTIPGVGNIQSNAGHSDSKGVEVSLKARPLSGLEVQLNYGYTYARFLEYKKSETIDLSGKILPMVPRNTFSGVVNYSLYRPCRSIDRLMFNVSVTGIGKIYWLEDNMVSQPFYALLNSKITATKGKFSWEIWTKNITNTDYMSYYFAANGKFAQKGKPFTIGTSLVINL